MLYVKSGAFWNVKHWDRLWYGWLITSTYLKLWDVIIDHRPNCSGVVVRVWVRNYTPSCHEDAINYPCPSRNTDIVNLCKYKMPRVSIIYVHRHASDTRRDLHSHDEHRQWPTFRRECQPLRVFSDQCPDSLRRGRRRLCLDWCQLQTVCLLWW